MSEYFVYMLERSFLILHIRESTCTRIECVYICVWRNIVGFVCFVPRDKGAYAHCPLFARIQWTEESQVPVVRSDPFRFAH